ncbi:TPA: hypothetical protein DCL37_04705 [Candidatus Acetothermia bacterium]|nr:hypothetical protein [Candidatus Acetothermia bacterium]
MRGRSQGRPVVAAFEFARRFFQRAKREITRQLAEAGKIPGIEPSDHLIVTRGGWLSLRREGHL